jgi:secondary thiamine-phosphate synthase enzyme
MVHQEELSLGAQGRGTRDITELVAGVVAKAGVRTGTCNVFLAHTSASLIVTENADPQVRRDLEAWLSKVVPDGSPMFGHTAEGPDDMPAHVRSALLETSVTIPISGGGLALGTWQGLFLFEHRIQPHARRLTVTVVGA